MCFSLHLSMLSPLVLLYDPPLLAAASFWISISKRLASKEADEHISTVVPDAEQRRLVLEVIVPQLLAFYKEVVKEGCVAVGPMDSPCPPL